MQAGRQGRGQQACTPQAAQSDAEQAASRTPLPHPPDLVSIVLVLSQAAAMTAPASLAADSATSRKGAYSAAGPASGWAPAAAAADIPAGAARWALASAEGLDHSRLLLMRLLYGAFGGWRAAQLSCWRREVGGGLQEAQ